MSAKATSPSPAAREETLWQALVDLRAVREERSALRKRVLRITRARDYWRDRALRVELQPPEYGRRMREITASRDLWRKRALDAEKKLRLGD